MQEVAAAAAGIPIADGGATDDPDEAMRLARALGGAVAVKADGLAARQGRRDARNADDAEQAIRATMVEEATGEAGRRVVVSAPWRARKRA